MGRHRKVDSINVFSSMSYTAQPTTVAVNWYQVFWHKCHAAIIAQVFQPCTTAQSEQQRNIAVVKCIRSRKEQRVKCRVRTDSRNLFCWNWKELQRRLYRVVVVYTNPGNVTTKATYPFYGARTADTMTWQVVRYDVHAGICCRMTAELLMPNINCSKITTTDRHQSR